MNELLPKTQSVIKHSAVKQYALKVSKEQRAGKFTRVGKAFLLNVEADVEAVIRGLAVEGNAPETDSEFITKEAMRRIRLTLQARTKAIIAGKVRRHPTVGCTLLD